MFVRSSRWQTPTEPASSLEANFAGGSGESDQGEQVPDEFKSNPLFQRLYNENRKTQRILGKKDKELEQLRAEMTAFKNQMQGLAGILGGRAPGTNDEEDNENKVSYLEKVQRAHQAIKEQDPNSGGLSLTLEGAELLEALRKENAQLKSMTERMMHPQFTAEQQLFMRTEANLKDKIAELYGSDEAVIENYPDFERVAIERMKAIKADPKKWASLLTNQKMQDDFVKNIITAKLPKMANVPGWQKIDTYSVEDAKKDMARAEALAREGKRDEASRLQSKARQTLLPYTLGIQMD